MPLIEVHLIENVFSPEQKRQMISKLTDAMVAIEGEAMRGATWVKSRKSRAANGGSADRRSRPRRSRRWPPRKEPADPERRGCRPFRPATRLASVHAAIGGPISSNG